MPALVAIGRAGRRFAALAAGVALATGTGACDPEPGFPANDPALAALDATVIYEREVVADGVEHILSSYIADFSVPADVAPLGTRFTIRIVKVATLAPVDAADMQWFVGGPSGIAALVTPETISFTSPVVLWTLSFPNRQPAGDVYVLRARSTDVAWTRGVTLTPPYMPAVVQLDGGGLWSVAYQLVARP